MVYCFGFRSESIEKNNFLFHTVMFPNIMFSANPLTVFVYLSGTKPVERHEAIYR